MNNRLIALTGLLLVLPLTSHSETIPPTDCAKIQSIVWGKRDPKTKASKFLEESGKKLITIDVESTNLKRLSRKLGENYYDQALALSAIESGLTQPHLSKLSELSSVSSDLTDQILDLCPLPRKSKQSK